METTKRVRDLVAGDQAFGFRFVEIGVTSPPQRVGRNNFGERVRLLATCMITGRTAWRWMRTDSLLREYIPVNYEPTPIDLYRDFIGTMISSSIAYPMQGAQWDVASAEFERVFGPDTRTERPCSKCRGIGNWFNTALESISTDSEKCSVCGGTGKVMVHRG